MFVYYKGDNNILFDSYQCLLCLQKPLTTSVSNNLDNLLFFTEKVVFPKSVFEKFQLVKWYPPLNT